MIIINIYGTIKPTVISKKLGLGVRNIPDEWHETLIKEMEKETSQLDNPLQYFSFYESMKKKNSLSQKNTTNVISLSDMQPYFKHLSENLITLDVIDFENSLLQLKNSYMHSPMCEEDFSKKIIKLLRILDSIQERERLFGHCFLDIIYDSKDRFRKTGLLTSINPNLKDDAPPRTKTVISNLQSLGKLLDDFFNDEEDFFLFDYLVNAFNFEKKYDTYHLFNIMALIEMLITNPKNNGQVMDELVVKMPLFMMNSHIKKHQQKAFCRSVKKIRNKIAHGDFQGLRKLLQIQREKFMKTFYFNEYEYSLDNWVLSSICIELEGILKEILWLLFNNRSKLNKIQFANLDKKIKL